MEKRYEWLKKDYRGWVFLLEGAVICHHKHDLLQLIEDAEKKGYIPMGTDIVYVD